MRQSNLLKGLKAKIYWAKFLNYLFKNQAANRHEVGNNMGPFIRPIQWICSLMDDQVVEWEVFGVKASNTSYGHRFLTKSTSDASSGEEISIKHANDYIDQLKKHHVLVSIQERKDKILHELESLMDISLLDQALLQEVTHLTEYPTALNVEFPQSFLDLPNEVLVACLKKHQKAFMIQKMGPILINAL